MRLKANTLGGKVQPSTFWSYISCFLNIKYGIKFQQSLHHSLHLAEEGEIREKKETGDICWGYSALNKKKKKKLIKMNELLKISLFTVHSVVLPEDVNHGTVMRTQQARRVSYSMYIIYDILVLSNVQLFCFCIKFFNRKL